MAGRLRRRPALGTLRRLVARLGVGLVAFLGHRLPPYAHVE